VDRYGSEASEFGFEDLELYKQAREFRKRIYMLVKRLPDVERFALAQQMRRAATSVTSNIAEGYGRHHWQESIQFCRHSRGSLFELVEQTNTCADEGYCDSADLQAIRDNAATVLRLLNGYIGYLQRQKEMSKD